MINLRVSLLNLPHRECEEQDDCRREKSLPAASRHHQTLHNCFYVKVDDGQFINGSEVQTL